MDKKKGFVISFFKYILNDTINNIKLNIICKVLMKIGIYKIFVFVVVIL
jgi:hypothetical protein